VNILAIRQARHLFEVNKDALCVGRLALEAFAGMRYSSAARLKFADIDFEEKGITMPGPQHKSGKRHYVDGWPENLWLWIERAPRACWDRPRHDYLRLKRQAFEQAGLKPTAPGNGKTWSTKELAQFDAMRNVLRPSAATYHLAAYRNPRLKLYLMTKKSLSSLNHDYRGRATQAAGLEYYGIAP
jgi:integrase